MYLARRAVRQAGRRLNLARARDLLDVQVEQNEPSDADANAISRERIHYPPKAAPFGTVFAVSWIAGGRYQVSCLARQFRERLIAISTILSILPIVCSGFW